ncbi:polymer-forming cytoskeletal protein [Urechidicola sp. KH5]
MFTEKKANESKTISERNIVSKNTIIKGDIESEGDFRIDGTVEGTIKTSGRIIVGASGKIIGTITCANADFEGSFEGKIMVTNLLTLKSSAKIEGEVHIQKLSVEPGATFDATCSMKSGVKDLTLNENKKTGQTA